MNEDTIPAVIEQKEEETQFNFADKSLAELSELFSSLTSAEDAISRSKEAEAIKNAFYKVLNKMKGESSQTADASADNYAAIEENFKACYAEFKQRRAEFNREQEAQREENLKLKKAIVEELKALTEGAEEPMFTQLREIQNRWREAGQVPVTAYRDLNDTYQFYVEKFYDRIQINRDLRDLDFKKNLEAKLALCEAAEKLAENEKIVDAFAELQRLHEQWKEYGPVEKEAREEIWNRFKAATAVINKKYQAYFEEIKAKQVENLAAKEKLCEKIEELVGKEISSSSEWNAISKQIENIQAEWKKIGFAVKKENQKIYDRFRASCDSFFERKKSFYSEFKSEMEENLAKKEELIRRVEEIKSSTEWKKATEQIIALQKEWKEIGAVPRKKSEELWKRFRGACDEFFAAKEKNAKPENNFYSNLKAKKALIEEVKAYQSSDTETDNTEAMKHFNERWNSIGFVPMREKESIVKAFREAMQEKFPLYANSEGRRQPKQLSAKEQLIKKYNALQQDITTYENNIGFFSSSKGAAALIKQMEDRIAAAKEELKELENQIRKAEEESK